MLLDTDAGLSLHFDNLETRFSFRTRILDYLWAKIPVICTEGDVFACRVEKNYLGAIVPYQNPKALADAIESILFQPEKVAAMKKNIEVFRENYTWDVVIQPILDYMKTNDSAKTSRWMDQASVWRAFIKHKDLLSALKNLVTK